MRADVQIRVEDFVVVVFVPAPSFLRMATRATINPMMATMPMI